MNIIINNNSSQLSESSSNSTTGGRKNRFWSTDSAGDYLNLQENDPLHMDDGKTHCCLCCDNLQKPDIVLFYSFFSILTSDKYLLPVNYYSVMMTIMINDYDDGDDDCGRGGVDGDGDNDDDDLDDDDIDLDANDDMQVDSGCADISKVAFHSPDSNPLRFVCLYMRMCALTIIKYIIVYVE